MTAVLILLALVVGVAVGRGLPNRREFNRGVVYGRASELLEHGWRPDMALAVPRPRRWRRLDRKPEEPAPSYAPWVDAHR